MDPATQYVVATGVFAVLMALIAVVQTALMYWLGYLKEQRQNKAAEEAEKRADERAKVLHDATEKVATKLENSPVPATEAHIGRLEAAVEVVRKESNGNVEKLVNEVRAASFAAGAKSETDKK